MMFCLFNGQLTTDKNERKYTHMSIIIFPVCVYAAIHYKQRRQMDDSINWKEVNYKMRWSEIEEKKIKWNKIKQNKTK